MRGRVAAGGATSTSCQRSCWRPRNTLAPYLKRCVYSSVAVIFCLLFCNFIRRTFGHSVDVFDKHIVFPWTVPLAPPLLLPHLYALIWKTSPNFDQQAIAWEKAQGGQGDKVIEDNAKVTEDDVLTVPPPPCIGRPSVCAAAAPTPCSAAAAGTVTVPPGDSVATGGAASAVSGDAQAGSPLGKRGGGRADDGTDDDGGEADAEDADAATKSWDTVELSSPAVVRRVAKELEGYRLPEGAVAALRETLEGFVGTKNYHNYTNHKKPTDPSCKR